MFTVDLDGFIQVWNISNNCENNSPHFEFKNFNCEYTVRKADFVDGDRILVVLVNFSGKDTVLLFDISDMNKLSSHPIYLIEHLTLYSALGGLAIDFFIDQRNSNMWF